MTLGFEPAHKEAVGKPTNIPLRTKVPQTDVFVSWRTTAETAAGEFASRADLIRQSFKRRRFGFFALPPRERLRLDQMQRLERAGLRIVHVPANLAGAEIEQVREYLIHRLQKLRESTMPAKPSRVTERVIAGGADGAAFENELLGDNDDGQLEAINDPDNAIDDLT